MYKVYCITSSDRRAFHAYLALIREIKYPGRMLIPYPLESKPPPPKIPIHMVQTGEGAYFQICTIRLEYKPSTAGGFADSLLSAYIMLI